MSAQEAFGVVRHSPTGGRRGHSGSRAGRLPCKERVNRLGWLRLAEEVSLPLRAALMPQMVEFLPRLDALGGRRHVQTAAQTNDRAHDGHGILVGTEIADEGPVNLDLVEGKTAQIAERGVAGAEVVHRDARAQHAQLVQGGQRSAAVYEQDGLR